MGLSIHYNGSFKKDASLIEMINEVKDIAEIYAWNYAILNTDFPDNDLNAGDYDGKLYGITFTPPNSETITLTFLSNRRMCFAHSLMLYGNSAKEQDQRYLYMLSSKTQFAGSAVHKVIIHLLKYLSQKYFHEFRLTDEGEYWETSDEILLEKNFKFYNEILNNVVQSLKNFPQNGTESFTDYFERIITMLHEKRKKD